MSCSETNVIATSYITSFWAAGSWISSPTKYQRYKSRIIREIEIYRRLLSAYKSNCTPFPLFRLFSSVFATFRDLIFIALDALFFISYLFCVSHLTYVIRVMHLTRSPFSSTLNVYWMNEMFLAAHQCITHHVMVISKQSKVLFNLVPWSIWKTMKINHLCILQPSNQIICILI